MILDIEVKKAEDLNKLKEKTKENFKLTNYR